MLHHLIASRWAGVRLYDGPDLKLLGLELFRLLLGQRDSFASDFQWCCFTFQGSPVARQHVESVESSSLNLFGTFRDLFVFTVMIH